tara:strand:+ start:582 stop:809 length:228 start_codon:yes stop_codon:yes gene_type:complete
MSAITVSPGQTTIIKKITVGTPVRNVTEASTNINNLAGINTSAKVNGSVLVYNASSTLWEATLDLEQQNVNGGSF